MLFEIHSLLVKHAQFTETIDNGNVPVIIRTNNFKLFPNAAKRQDGLFHIYAHPSEIKDEMENLYQEFDRLSKQNISSIAFAAWLHSSYI